MKKQLTFIFIFIILDILFIYRINNKSKQKVINIKKSDSLSIIIKKDSLYIDSLNTKFSSNVNKYLKQKDSLYKAIDIIKQSKTSIKYLHKTIIKYDTTGHIMEKSIISAGEKTKENNNTYKANIIQTKENLLNIIKEKDSIINKLSKLNMKTDGTLTKINKTDSSVILSNNYNKLIIGNKITTTINIKMKNNLFIEYNKQINNFLIGKIGIEYNYKNIYNINNYNLYSVLCLQF